MGLSTLFLVFSSLLLLSTVSCNHDHHDNHNQRKDFHWQSFLPPFIVLENTTDIISSTTTKTDGTKTNRGTTFNFSFPEHSTSEPTSDYGISESTQESTTSLVGLSDTTFDDVKEKFRLGLGVIISIPIVGILFLVLCCYCICKCCCSTTETPGVVVMQNNPGQVAPPAPPPQIIVQQPIYQVPHSYDMQQQRWAQPAQPPQWTPQPRGQQVQYSPNSAYDNPNYTGPVAPPPPPYNTGKY